MAPLGTKLWGGIDNYLEAVASRLQELTEEFSAVEERVSRDPDELHGDELMQAVELGGARAGLLNQHIQSLLRAQDRLQNWRSSQPGIITGSMPGALVGCFHAIVSRGTAGESDSQRSWSIIILLCAA